MQARALEYSRGGGDEDGDAGEDSDSLISDMDISDLTWVSAKCRAGGNTHHHSNSDHHRKHSQQLHPAPPGLVAMSARPLQTRLKISSTRLDSL
mgnify:CR=1 FL=1